MSACIKVDYIWILCAGIGDAGIEQVGVALECPALPGLSWYPFWRS